ncbi:hypothetical protein FHR93_000725 [Geodermatophilus sabuli]|uniref:Uncharacterized protein n=1 Tax=Geodermatophilus sabuli TaxID=1564158 RepID=A0A285E6F0_9ACTN|nr:hypothetical protein [Geodermatophilus sabuli]SNX94587.1 hypothetical protein SAMN06893097_101384 [Geodermatophilus sabuli]
MTAAASVPVGDVGLGDPYPTATSRLTGGIEEELA